MTVGLQLTNGLTKESGKGQILFKYKISLETNHNTLLLIEEKLENRLQHLYNNCLNNALENLPKKDVQYLTNLPSQEQKYNFIKKYFIKFFCEQESEIELPLTAEGDQFYNCESEKKYQEFVTEYCNTIAFLKNILRRLKLDSTVQLTARSVVKANDAEQKEVSGPKIRHIPMF
jgi:hypothetical protein